MLWLRKYCIPNLWNLNDFIHSQREHFFVLKKLIEFLGSLRFTIFLLLIIAFFCIIGIILPQGLQPSRYTGMLGDKLGSVFLAAGFNHIFDALWFYGLLGLLSISLTICILTRLMKKIHRIFKPDCAWSFISLQRLSKDIGSILFHFGLLLLYAGGVVGKFAGFSFHADLSDNEVIPIPKRSFIVRADGFRLETNDRGEVKKYQSRLSILNPDSTIACTKVIEVNDPLTYHGIRFYQASYSLETNKIKNAELKIEALQKDSSAYTGWFPFNRAVPIPNMDIRIKIVKFLPDFIMNLNNRQASSRSKSPNNPAVQIVLTRDRDTLFYKWVFLKYPDIHPKQDLYRITFVDYEADYVTGILIKYNPGSFFVWVGLLLMSFGILSMFFFPHFRIRNLTRKV